MNRLLGSYWDHKTRRIMSIFFFKEKQSYIRVKEMGRNFHSDIIAEVKLCSHDPILLDYIHFWRMECKLLLISQYFIGLSWFAAHIHCESTDCKISIKSGSDKIGSWKQIFKIPWFTVMGSLIWFKVFPSMFVINPFRVDFNFLRPAKPKLN